MTEEKNNRINIVLALLVVLIAIASFNDVSSFISGFIQGFNDGMQRTS